MDNALIIDGVLLAALIIGALIGAKRGLFKSLMGLVVVAVALVGSVFLANQLTEPITNMIAPRVEDAVVQRFSETVDQAGKNGAASAEDSRSALRELLEKNKLPADMLDSLFASLSGAMSDASGAAKEKATDAFRNAISATVRATVSGAVRTVLTLVLYIVLLVVLRLLVNLIDSIFSKTAVGTVNALGGAALGFVEAALLLYAAVYIGAHLGVKIITEHANDTYLLPIFLNHSPVELISSFTHKG